MARTWKHLSERDFKTIKALQDAGLSIGKTADATGRSYITVKRVYDSKTIMEYRVTVTAVNVDNKKTSPQPEAQPTKPEKITVPDRRSVDEQILALQKRNVLAQEQQARALTRLATAWEKAPTKKGLFS